MKKVLVCLAVVLASVVTAQGKSLGFAYEAGADLTSAYLWRGMYNGGLSFQPSVAVGWDSQNTSFRIGAWASVGSSDWKFSKQEVAATFFVPEVDITASFSVFGLTIGATHYYYCDGTNFWNWGKDVVTAMNDHSSQTEVMLGYDFSATTPAGLYINWYTMVAGADAYEGDEGWKRAYSSYIELGYTVLLPLDITLDFQVGMTPWKSMYTDYEGGFAVNNISGRLDVPISIGDFMEINIFAQGSINTYKINKENAFVDAAGEDKIGVQRLNGCVGVGVWF